MLLIEATLPRPERTGDPRPPDAARGRRPRPPRGRPEARVTHFSDELDPEWCAAEASRGFGGPVELAEEGAVYTVAPAPARP